MKKKIKRSDRERGMRIKIDTHEAIKELSIENGVTIDAVLQALLPKNKRRAVTTIRLA